MSKLFTPADLRTLLKRRVKDAGSQKAFAASFSYQFSWYARETHTPYPIGREFLPDPDSLPQTPPSHLPHDGLWRFGRTVNEDEMRLWPEVKVRRELDAALAEYRRAQ